MPRHKPGSSPGKGKKRRSCTSGSDHKRRASLNHRRRVLDPAVRAERPRPAVGRRSDGHVHQGGKEWCLLLNAAAPVQQLLT